MLNSFSTRTVLVSGDEHFTYYRLDKLQEDKIADISRLPLSIKILLESALRGENGKSITRTDILHLAHYNPLSPARIEIPFLPTRVLLQDFTGVPAVVDLAAMRSAMARLGGNPERINPQVPVDLVIDHSVQVDWYNSVQASAQNAKLEFERNYERYTFLRWGQKALKNFRVVPPASGIVHQVNLEYLGEVVRQDIIDGQKILFPDSLVGTDSHTTMINGLGIVGWGVGGIEAEACMLGQPIYMLLPEVIGFKLYGELPEGTTATDLVLVVTEMLRKKKVVGKFVEFYGPGLSAISLPDRATIANMAPEYGATIGFFPVDQESINYLRRTGRPEKQVECVEQYCQSQGLFRTDRSPDPLFQDTLELDLSTVHPSIAGPKRPQDRLDLGEVKGVWQRDLRAPVSQRGFNLPEEDLNRQAVIPVDGIHHIALKHGDVVIAAITSCTNTSNPSVMLGAGILAKKAVEAGLYSQPYVKTSLAPGSKVVTAYLERAGLMPYLEALGFYLVGYGCTTCIGNSGPLLEPIAQAIDEIGLVVAGVLSGNRNFEGRIHPQVRANYLASPPLVVAYAIAGTININLQNEPLGRSPQGREIYLKDIWPTSEEIAQYMDIAYHPDTFRKVYGAIESGNETWNKLPVNDSPLYVWDAKSTYIQEPPFFMEMATEPKPISSIKQARVLVKLRDSVTTDHISPAGAIPPHSPAGEYLIEQGVQPRDFNSYGSRRGNDRVMTRGTFANIRLKNDLAPGTEGGWTTFLPTGEVTSIYAAARRYQEAGTPTIIIAGQDYGMGSSRDWAAKGTFLLGVRAVLAQSFERIHRSNLLGMGVLPLQFREGESAETWKLTGHETYNIILDEHLQPGQQIIMEVQRDSSASLRIPVLCRIDTPIEVEYYRNGGILHMVLRRLLEEG